MIRLLTFLFLSSFSHQALADFIFSPGVIAPLPNESTNNNSAGDPWLKMDTGFGFLLDVEPILFGPVSLNFGVSYSASTAEANYFYTNSKNASDTGSMKELSTSASNFQSVLGPRLRWINFKKFKSYIGGGILVGILGLTYDEDEYAFFNGSKIGFEESEVNSFNGYYTEAGFEYIMSNKSALRLSGRNHRYKTQKFETLGDKKISFNNFQAAIQYMHYVDFSFFWK